MSLQIDCFVGATVITGERTVFSTNGAGHTVYPSTKKNLPKVTQEEIEIMTTSTTIKGIITKFFSTKETSLAIFTRYWRDESSNLIKIFRNFFQKVTLVNSFYKVNTSLILKSRKNSNEKEKLQTNLIWYRNLKQSIIKSNPAT